MRESVVTRTIKKVNASVVALNKESKETYFEELEIPFANDDKALLKLAKKVNPDVLAIVSYDVVEELREMTEADFIKYSHVIPARTKATAL